jgi:phage gp16-like protein
MTPAHKKWIQVIHVAKKECGLDDVAYQALLEGSAGVSSSKEITAFKQYNDILTAFKNLGFRVNSKTSKTSGLKEPDKTERNPDWISGRQEYYIRGLWDLASRKKSIDSLTRMIKRIGKVDNIRFLKKVDAQKVILALRDITEKAGYNPDESK